MSEWVKSGLKMRLHADINSCSLDWMEVVRERSKAVFGKTLNESRDEVEHLLDLFREEQNRLTDGTYDDQLNEAVFATNPQLLPLKQHQEFRKLYDDWEWAQPEAIEYERLIKEAKEFATTNSFSYSPNMKAGTLIEVRHNKSGNVVQYLIGNINEYGTDGGNYNDNQIEDDDEVIRYKTVWTKED